MSINLNDASAAETFLQSQTTIIQREVNLAPNYGILYPQFVPVVGGNPWANSVTFLSTKKFGEAGYINGNADDVPMADATLQASVSQVYMGGIGYGYGLAEINEARQGGVNLGVEKALAARRAYQLKIEDIVFNGDSTRGFTGLKGLSGTTATTGTAITKWTTSTTAQDIANDLVTLMKLTGPGNAPTADTLVMEDGQYDIADTTFFSNGSMTAIDYIKRKYPGLRVAGISGLKNGSSKEMYIAYRRSPDVLALRLPMAHRFLPVYKAGPLRWEVPGIFRVGGMNFRSKQDIAFVTAS